MTGRQAVDGRHTGADDTVLLDLVAGGDRDALGALYRRHARVVLAQIRLAVGEPGPSGFPLGHAFPRPAGLSAVPPNPGALFSGLGCNAPAIAATGLLAFGR